MSTHPSISLTRVLCGVFLVWYRYLLPSSVIGLLGVPCSWEKVTDNWFSWWCPEKGDAANTPLAYLFPLSWYPPIALFFHRLLGQIKRCRAINSIYCHSFPLEDNVRSLIMKLIRQGQPGEGPLFPDISTLCKFICMQSKPFPFHFSLQSNRRIFGRINF